MAVANVDTVDKAFLKDLCETYDAENQFIQAMQQMQSVAQNAQVKQGLQQHIGETQQQIANLDRVFGSMGMQPEQMPCKGAAGIISEFQMGSRQITNPMLLDGFVVGCNDKVEHYEIAAYNCLIDKAQLIGNSEAQRLLQQNLQMEQRFSQNLEQLDKQLGQQLVSQHPELVGRGGSRR